MLRTALDPRGSGSVDWTSPHVSSHPNSFLNLFGMSFCGVSSHIVMSNFIKNKLILEFGVYLTSSVTKHILKAS